MNKNKGSSLTQYAIVLALLSIAVISVYTAFGQEINKILNKYLSVFTSNNTAVEANAKIASDGAQITMPTGVVGPLGGTPSNPVSQCTNSSCDIDFGSFLLKGVPENFGDFVVSNGSSGGIDKMCDLIYQMASQIEKTDPANSADLKDLANLGHFISDFAEKTESIAKSCMPATASNGFCVATKLEASSSYPLPSNISSLLPDFNSYKSGKSIINTIMLMSPANPWTDQMKTAVYSTTPTATGIYPVDHLIPVNEYTSDSSPGMKFSELYNKLKSSNLSPEQLSVVDKLYQNISSLANSQMRSTQSIYGFSKEQYYMYEYDGGDRNVVITGIYSPQRAKNVDLRSALICVTGKRYDNGSECKK